VRPVEALRAEVEERLVGLIPSSRVDRRLLLAISGGPDSTALLYLLLSLREKLGLTLFAAVVDHGLRAESASEANLVRSRIESAQVPASVLGVRPLGRSMAAARQVRYAALTEEAVRLGATRLVVGHTATDQAETLLDRLLRGAGLHGLSAMAPSRLVSAAAPGLLLIRPLLGLAREEIANYVTTLGFPIVHDPTNQNLHYKRSRLRHEVLPLLRRERPDLDLALSALCDRLRADDEALDRLAERARLERQLPDGSLDLTTFAQLEEAVAIRVLARQAQVPLSEVHLRALLHLCAHCEGTRRLDLPMGRMAERRYHRLRFGARPSPAASAEWSPEFEQRIDVPGRYHFFDREVEVPAALLTEHGGTLLLRNARPGDRIAIRDGHKKLQDLFVDAKVPRADRRKVPLLIRPREGATGEIVWMGALTEREAVQ
jgi:tRNA(Ile)-lysidine synthase